MEIPVEQSKNLMSPLQWKHIGHTVYEGVGPEGRWTTSDPRDDVADIKFTPRYPDGENYFTCKAKIDAMEAEGRDWVLDPEGQRLRSYTSHQELGYGQNRFEAECLIECIRRGDAGLPDAHEIVRAAGFELRHELDNWRGHFHIYTHKKKSALNITIATDSIHMSYDRPKGAGWHNLMQLSGDHRNERGDLFRIYYPDSVKDYQRVGAAYCIWLIEQRLKRGGRLYRPLEARYD